MCSQVVASGSAQAALLVRIDRSDGGRVLAVFAKPDFDENESRLVTHYQVDLAMSAAKVSLEQVEAVALQMFECQLFGLSRY
jgi:hypothetical protein